jgi:tetratricopeptide (TPR) repeat protein
MLGFGHVIARQLISPNFGRCHLVVLSQAQRRGREIMKHVYVLAMLVIAGLLIVTDSATADLFDDPKNLKVLPEDTSTEELRQMMRSISQGTGNRCSACHVGEVEADLSTYDFSLDDKEKKAKARKMIKMVQDINSSLANAFPNADEPLVAVTCATCHRGQSKPEMIEDVLMHALHDDGLDHAVAKYRELRDRYYGGYTFDFSERMLMRIAEDLGAQDELDAAMGFVNLNLEYFPESSRSYVLRAQVLTEQGDIDAARRDYETALGMEPDSWWIKEQLDKLN